MVLFVGPAQSETVPVYDQWELHSPEVSDMPQVAPLEVAEVPRAALQAPYGGLGSRAYAYILDVSPAGTEAGSGTGPGATAGVARAVGVGVSALALGRGVGAGVSIDALVLAPALALGRGVGIAVSDVGRGVRSLTVVGFADGAPGGHMAAEHEYM